MQRYIHLVANGLLVNSNLLFQNQLFNQVEIITYNLMISMGKLKQWIEFPSFNTATDSRSKKAVRFKYLASRIKLTKMYIYTYLLNYKCSWCYWSMVEDLIYILLWCNYTIKNTARLIINHLPVYHRASQYVSTVVQKI